MSATQTLTYTCPHCHTQVDVMPRAGEELVTCPACNKPFQVKVPEGDPVNRLILPGHLEPAATDDGAIETEAEKKPVLMAENLADKEEHMRTIHLDMFRRYPLRCAGYVGLFVGGIVFGFILLAEDWPILGFLLFGLALLALVRGLVWWLRIKNTTLTITTKRVIVETGILGKRSTEIPMQDIAEIRVGQNFFTRMVDVGDLTLVAAGAQKKHLVVMAVPQPAEVASAIRGQGVGKDSVPK